MKKMMAAVLAAGSMVLSILSVAACAPKSIPLTGTFVLASATLDGADVTDDFQAYSAAFSEDLYVLRKPGPIISAVRKVKGNLNSLRTK